MKATMNFILVFTMELKICGEKLRNDWRVKVMNFDESKSELELQEF
jgi:hypothetical protein